MFFSRATGPHGYVVAFDPLQENCKAIADNLSLNNLQNGQIIQVGVGSRKESKSFVFDPDVTQLASSNEEIKKAARLKSHFMEIAFKVDSLDAIIAERKLPLPDFIKIDVEGMETEVLEGMQDCMNKKKPELFIEVHGVNIEAGDIGSHDASTKNIKNLYNILKKFNYSITHVESSMSVNQSNFEIAKSGHIYCT